MSSDYKFRKEPLGITTATGAGHVVCMGAGEVHAGFWWRRVGGKCQLEDLGVDGSMILKWIFEKWEVKHGLG
jgi:hypothetical protein